MNDLAKRDLEALTSYIFNFEIDDFANCVMNESQSFPGLTNEEIEKLDSLEVGSVEWVELLDKAAVCEENMHVYACAVRLWNEFLKE